MMMKTTTEVFTSRLTLSATQSRFGRHPFHACVRRTHHLNDSSLALNNDDFLRVVSSSSLLRLRSWSPSLTSVVLAARGPR